MYAILSENMYNYLWETGFYKKYIILFFNSDDLQEFSFVPFCMVCNC